MAFANSILSDIRALRENALSGLDTTMKLFFEKIQLFPKLVCELKIINNRYFIHVSQIRKIKKHSYKKQVTELLYVICAELQIMKCKYYLVTYPVKFQSVDGKEKYIRPDIKYCKIYDNPTDLFLQLHDDAYYREVNFE